MWPRAHAPEEAGGLRIGDHVDAGADQRLQLGARIGARLRRTRRARFLRADDAVERLVERGLLGREIGEPAGREALRRDQAHLVVDEVVPPDPIAEHQLGGVAVEPGALLGGDRGGDLNRRTARSAPCRCLPTGRTRPASSRWSGRRCRRAARSSSPGCAARTCRRAAACRAPSSVSRGDGGRAVRAVGERLRRDRLRRRAGRLAGGRDHELRRSAQRPGAGIHRGDQVDPEGGEARRRDVVEHFRREPGHGDGEAPGVVLRARPTAPR